MSKFVNSREAIVSPLLLWKDKPTQVAVQETYEIKTYPVTNLFNEGPIHFSISPQPHGMLRDVDIVTKFRIDNGNERITEIQPNLSVINNFANALWELVEVRVGDRIDLMQSMKNSYAYQTFFNTALNGERDRESILFQNEIFKMDTALDRNDAEDTAALTQSSISILQDAAKSIVGMTDEELTGSNTLQTDKDGETLEASLMNIDNVLTKQIRKIKKDGKYLSPNPKNLASGQRAMRINNGQSVTVSSKLQCPLLRTEKCLPTDINLRISLSKNSDDFLLLAPKESKYRVVIEDIYLNVKYLRPIDTILTQINEHLEEAPAPYFTQKGEIIIRPITNSNRILRVNDIFQGKLPTHAFFALTQNRAFSGTRDSNPFVFVPYARFQLYVDGTPYFLDPLEASYTEVGNKKIYTETGEFSRQLYETIGRDFKGDCFITPENFQLNFIVGASFTADRSNTSSNYLNLQEKANANIEIDIGYDTDIPTDMVLIVYTLHDRQIQINGDREFTIIE